MWQIIKLAFRNVFRYKRRTIITFSTVSLGLALLIISISLLNGIDKQARENIINSQVAHLTIFSNGYYQEKDELPLDKTIKQPELTQIKKRLEDVPGIKAIETRILFPVNLIKGMDELPLVGVGIEPEKDPMLFNIKESLEEGNWLEPNDKKILIGKELANNMGLTVGDLITVRMIISSKEELTWNAFDLEIKGIFNTGNPNVNSSYLIMPEVLAQEGLSLNGEVTEIVARLDGNELNQSTLLKVQNQFKEIVSDTQTGLEVYTWDQLAGTFLLLSKFKSKRSAMVVFIMLFIAAMGIINTMLMAVWERTREIGMFKAMGMKAIDIKKLFIFEGGVIGLFGSIIGCIIGGIAGWFMETKGMPLGAGDTFKQIVASVYPLKDVMYADITLNLLLLAFLLGIIVSVAASLYPASKAAKMSPIKALKHI